MSAAHDGEHGVRTGSWDKAGPRAKSPDAWWEAMLKGRYGAGIVGSLLLLLIVGSTLVVIGGAGAASQEEKMSNQEVGELVKEIGDSDNPGQEIQRLSPGTRKKVVNYLKVDRIKKRVVRGNPPGADGPSHGPTSQSKSSIQLTSQGSDVYVIEVYGENAVGVKLWSYYQEIYWGYDGEQVTRKIRKRWGDTHMLGWSFDGHTGSTESGGVGETYYSAWTQGEFSLCIGGDLGCVQHTYPWINQAVYGDGSRWGNSGE